MPVFASAPRVIREGLLFPYVGGADFVRRFIEQRPIAELLTDLPVSSKQILNDAAYFTGTAPRDAPTSVALPAPVAGTVRYQNTFGEFESRLVLVQHLKDEVLARRAAGGMDGDRYAVIDVVNQQALVWASVWDSAVDAGDFLDLLTDALRRRYDVPKPTVPPGATTRSLAIPANGARGARTVTLVLEQVGGRPVVVLMDVPAGAPVTIIDAARITLGS
jgi:hypothetical protein